MHGWMRTPLFGFLILTWLTASIADAQPAGAQAEALFNSGKALMKDGKIAEACAAFAASQRLDPASTTLINLASCREKNGQLATAWGLFLQVERDLRAASGTANDQLRNVARERATKLEPRVSKLTLNVTAPTEQLEVVRNGERVDRPLWNQPLPVDGGTYEVMARAPGRTSWSVMVTVASEGDTKVLDIPALEIAQVESPSAAPPPPPPSVTTQPAHPQRSVLPYVLGGSAIALGGAALGFHLWGNSLYDEAKDASRTNAERTTSWDAANARRYVAQGLVVAGVGCAGIAIYLAVRSKDQPSESTSKISLAPLVAEGGFGFQANGTW